MGDEASLRWVCGRHQLQRREDSIAWTRLIIESGWGVWSKSCKFAAALRGCQHFFPSLWTWMRPFENSVCLLATLFLFSCEAHNPDVGGDHYRTGRKWRNDWMRDPPDDPLEISSTTMTPTSSLTEPHSHSIPLPPTLFSPGTPIAGSSGHPSASALNPTNAISEGRLRVYQPEEFDAGTRKLWVGLDWMDWLPLAAGWRSFPFSSSHSELG